MVHKHHRKRRSQGGDDSAENIIELAPEVHEAVHRNPQIAYETGLLVHSWANPADVPVDLEQFLDRVFGDAGTVGHSDPVNQGVAEGEECPKCHRRVPRKKKASSPKTKVVSIRVPIDDADTFQELLDAAAVNGGLRDKGHWQFWTVHRGLVLLLQEPAA